LEPFGPDQANHPRNDCMISCCGIKRDEWAAWNRRAAPAAGTVDKALEQAAIICEDRAMHWQQTEGSYAAGEKAGALDCAESIRAAIEAHNTRSPSCGS
jgi:hypothetical protein